MPALSSKGFNVSKCLDLQEIYKTVPPLMGRNTTVNNLLPSHHTILLVILETSILMKGLIKGYSHDYLTFFISFKEFHFQARDANASF